MKAALAKASSDLKFLMDEAGVSLQTQAKVYTRGLKVYTRGFINVRIFSGLDDTKEKVRAALCKELPLDYEADAAARVDMALLLSVWESCRTQWTVGEQHRADSKLGVQSRIVPTTEYAAMREAIEAVHGSLRDKELPSKSLLAQKLEQVEDNAPHVEDLRDVTSLEDSQIGSYETVIDPASTFLRIKPGKTMTTPPANPEELRMRHRRIGLAWEMLRTKHSSRSWLPSRCLDGFRKLSDHILGDRIAGIHSPDGRSPAWSLILQYESEVRKHAYRLVRDGSVADLNSALSAACVAPEIYTMHFIGPLTFASASSGATPSPAADEVPWRKRSGKGKGKGKEKGLDVKKTIRKHHRTQDGQLLCFGYNKPSGCTKKNCHFAHVCQHCLGNHSYINCRQVERVDAKE